MIRELTKKFKGYFQNVELYLLVTLILIFILHFSLSIFSYPTTDGSYYLLETSNMADILSNGQWIGNEAVGLHGFLFKLPVALLFMLFGPSVFIGNISNVILATASSYLFYRILEKYFDEIHFKIIGIIILVTSYHFVITSSSFLREIPVLFSFLLLLYLLINNKHKLLVGLSLLLILDAKEYVFFILMPGFLLWLLYSHFFKKKDMKIVIKINDFFKNCLFYFSPSLLYLLFMFLTGLVPINMFTAYILGTIEKGFSPLANSFLQIGAHGGTSEKELAQSIISKFISEKILINNYLFKFFLPRMVSFLSIPKLVVVPALITSWISFFKKNTELKEDSKLYFFLLWSYFLIFYLRTSHGRYLLSISPVIIIFFLQFLRNINNNRKNTIIILITFFFITFGFLFEFKYLLIKISLNIVLMALLSIFLFNNVIKHLKKERTYLLFGIILGFFTFSTALAASYFLEEGQLRNYLIHGSNGEIYKISKKINNDSKIWTNVGYSIDLRLFKFYRKERIETPEWNWKLKSHNPKKSMLKHHPSEKTFSFVYDNMNDFKEKLFEKDVDWICFLYSTNLKRSYHNQEQINMVQSQKFLKLTDIMEIKNKKVYIFKVIK